MPRRPCARREQRWERAHGSQCLHVSCRAPRAPTDDRSKVAAWRALHWAPPRAHHCAAGGRRGLSGYAKGRLLTPAGQALATGGAAACAPTQLATPRRKTSVDGRVKERLVRKRTSPVSRSAGGVWSSSTWVPSTEYRLENLTSPAPTDHRWRPPPPPQPRHPTTPTARSPPTTRTQKLRRHRYLDYRLHSSRGAHATITATATATATNQPPAAIRWRHSLAPPCPSARPPTTTRVARRSAR
eukprot:COSAG04_NODE_1875_length_5334_cov_1.252197_9_plen_242_part_00